MRHQTKLIKSMENLGFVFETIPGFLSFTKGDQKINIFQWSNPKHANQTTIPKAYYVVVPYLVHQFSHGRYRVPLVEWIQGETNPEPSEQVYRPFEDVFEELNQLFLSTLDLPLEDADEFLDSIPERNIL